MLLSILIATLDQREYLYNQLYCMLGQQIIDGGYEDKVEIIQSCDDGSKNVGTKRNELLKKSCGSHIVFIDDDDLISPNYVSLIVSVIEQNPQVDCIGIQGTMTTNGKDQRQWFISKQYGSWYEKDRVYYRTPNHISPVRRDRALKAGFPNTRFGEDRVYSERLLPMLKSEIVIPENIYHYSFSTKKH
jgi:hypothetical protein